MHFLSVHLTDCQKKLLLINSKPMEETVREVGNSVSSERWDMDDHAGVVKSTDKV